ncbi:sodium-dependent transporter [Youxingia wuxianensis]|uniref:Sodium-dependent transporter n=1 Tax=Youxingia wuxianensis TaxID=2763678 RepID=A0A926EQJ7_9FIRM|nr:sodium-dependent transporter [Youxingia wuxianensis]MBC8584704.1 sodium-dependent transporter [Youxingia wuxianensis]
MQPKHRGQWATNLGFILAAAGSAVGLGNIWKFPGKVGENGGAAFIIVYLAIVLILGYTVMLTELTVGRATQKNTVGAFRQLDRRFTWIGVLGVITGFFVLSYYSVVGGWVMKYIVTYLTGGDFGLSHEGYFNQFIAKIGEPVGWHLLFMAIVVLVVLKGVSGGIEKVGKVFMPALFLFLILIAIRSLTLDGAQEGIRFLLRPDFSSLGVKGFAAALGQAFFSLSLGMGVMCTYGSYLPKNENLSKSALIICGLDSLVALISAAAIIPAVFSTGADLGMGSGFAFISLPGIFEKMPAGYFFGLLFFIMLFFAALTSAISILEGTVAFISEEFRIKRATAAIASAAAMALAGIGYSLASGAVNLRAPWFDFVNGWHMISLATWMELLTDNLLMPLGGLAFCIFAGWMWGVKNAVAEVEQGGKFKFYLKTMFSVSLKYICPAAIVIILFFTVGLGIGLS